MCQGVAAATGRELLFLTDNRGAMEAGGRCHALCNSAALLSSYRELESRSCDRSEVKSREGKGGEATI